MTIPKMAGTARSKEPITNSVTGIAMWTVFMKSMLAEGGLELHEHRFVAL